MLIPGQHHHSFQSKNPFNRLVVIVPRHLMRVTAADPGRLLIRWVHVKQGSGTVVAIEDFTPVIPLYLDIAKALVQSGNRSNDACHRRTTLAFPRLEFSTE
jgi:hypothetical protein